MSEKTILLCIDTCDSSGITGWCVLRDGTAFVSHPLYCDIAGDMVDIADFTFREDLKAAHLGEGTWAFAVQRPLAPGTTVTLYDQKTFRLIWSGAVGAAPLGMHSIPGIPVPVLEQPEACCHRLTDTGITGMDNTPCSGIHAYATALRVGTRPVWYFQLLGEVALFPSLTVAIAQCDVQAQHVCTLDGMSLYEYFVLPQDGALVAADMPCTCAWGENTLACSLTVDEAAPDTIFLFTASALAWVRPNTAIQLSAEPAFAWPAARESRAIVKPAVMAWDGARLLGTPACLRVDAPAARECRNTLPVEPAHDYRFMQPHVPIDYEGSMRILREDGPRALVAALYQHILSRDPDPNGLQSNTENFVNSLQQTQPLLAINTLWNLFIKSEEFRQRPFPVVAPRIAV